MAEVKFHLTVLLHLPEENLQLWISTLNETGLFLSTSLTPTTAESVHLPILICTCQQFHINDACVSLEVKSTSIASNIASESKHYIDKGVVTLRYCMFQDIDIREV